MYVYVYVYTYIYIYIHTHIHTYIYIKKFYNYTLFERIRFIIKCVAAIKIYSLSSFGSLWKLYYFYIIYDC